MYHLWRDDSNGQFVSKEDYSKLDESNRSVTELDPAVIVLPPEVFKTLNEQGGRFVISHSPQDSVNRWLVGIEFGEEAEDSDMAGGAAYGQGNTIRSSLMQCMKDLRK